MKLKFSSLYSVVIEGKSSLRFFLGAIFSFSFSIAVILSTIGLMDGFEKSLIDSLQRSSSDIVITSNQGFFDEEPVFNLLKKNYFNNISSLAISQSFAVLDQQSKAVLVHGVDHQFDKITGLKVKLYENYDVSIGRDLANFYKLKEGDTLTFIFSSTKSNDDGIPSLIDFNVSSIVEHGVYEKDLRFVYIKKEILQDIMGLKSKAINKIFLKTSVDKNIEEEVTKLNEILQPVESLSIKPFWNEFSSLLEAVKVEKFSITMILQLIVIVSVFNIIAFILFVVEKQAQSFFLLNALGLSKRLIMIFWSKLLILVWSVSCLISIGFTYVFDFLLQNLSIFKLPGDVYVLSKLSLDLEVKDFIIVFGIAAIWILIIGVVSWYKLKNKSLLSGLRQEFS